MSETRERGDGSAGSENVTTRTNLCGKRCRECGAGERKRKMRRQVVVRIEKSRCAPQA